MIDFLITLWALLPIPIGIFCLFMAAHIMSGSDEEDEDNHQTKHSTAENHEYSEHFGKETENLPKQRSLYFSLLFAGLGLGSVMIGLEVFDPFYGLIGKLIFFVTILSSVLIPLYLYRRENKKEKKNEKKDSDNTED